MAGISVAVRRVRATFKRVDLDYQKDAIVYFVDKSEGCGFEEIVTVGGFSKDNYVSLIYI